MPRNEETSSAGRQVAAGRGPGPRAAHRGLVLPIVLFVLILLGLLAASYAFHINARALATHMMIAKLQSRLAAESMLEKAKIILRDQRMNMSAWYDNPEELHRIIIYKPGADETVLGTNKPNEDDEDNFAIRGSLVADDGYDDEKQVVRFGMTDEQSKLDLNQATREQLLILIRGAANEREDVKVEDVVDAILDWRDSDSATQKEDGDTEAPYYQKLRTSYLIKNADFETVEELLLVKGVDGRLLYGEDQDRNGLLSPNEDDGDVSFPADNADGILNRGLYPFLTVHSVDRNISIDNRQRISIYGDPGDLRRRLMEEFDDPAKAEYVVQAVAAAMAARQPGGGTGAGQTSADGETTGGDGASDLPTDTKLVDPGGGQGGDANGGAAGGVTKGRKARPTGGGPRFEPEFPAGLEIAGSSAAMLRPSPYGGAEAITSFGLSALGQEGGAPSGNRGGTRLGSDPAGQDGSAGAGGADEGAGGGAGQEVDEDEGSGEGGEGEEGEGGEPRAGAPKDDRPIKSVALFLMDNAGGLQRGTPFTLADLPILLDRVSAEIRPEQRGLINVNTAQRPVLRCLPGLTEDQVELIATTRDKLEPDTKLTTAWLLENDIVTLEEFIKLSPHICARGTQFTLEAVGFADHMGMVTRLQVLVDVKGPVIQTLYYRDLTTLGGRYPLSEADWEAMRGAR